MPEQKLEVCDHHNRIEIANQNGVSIKRCDGCGHILIHPPVFDLGEMPLGVKAHVEVADMQEGQRSENEFVRQLVLAVRAMLDNYAEFERITDGEIIDRVDKAMERFAFLV
jgi:hypothetical protein